MSIPKLSTKPPKGQAMVETALIALLLLVLAFTAFELGNRFMISSAVIRSVSTASAGISNGCIFLNNDGGSDSLDKCMSSEMKAFTDKWDKSLPKWKQGDIIVTIYTPDLDHCSTVPIQVAQYKKGAGTLTSAFTAATIQPSLVVNSNGIIVTEFSYPIDELTPVASLVSLLTGGSIALPTTVNSTGIGVFNPGKTYTNCPEASST